jgi:putative chitinase
MIRIGSNGPMVKQLQNFLKESPDGVFGSFTEQSVKAWQTKNGLVPDGVVGPKTWGVMFPLEIEPFPCKLDGLRTFIPDEVILQIPQTAKTFNISSSLRLSHFLAQCAHESNNFSATRENLNYSADGLLRIFPVYFKTLSLAQQYQYKPELIASRVYGNRMGNGDEASREGFIFRGAGYIQLTGKNNFKAFDAFVDDDVVKNPEMVASKYPLMSAAWFFHVNQLWQLCDTGATDEAVKRVTRAVNGGFNGLDDRLRKFELFTKILSK